MEAQEDPKIKFLARYLAASPGERSEVAAGLAAADSAAAGEELWFARQLAAAARGTDTPDDEQLAWVARTSPDDLSENLGRTYRRVELLIATDEAVRHRFERIVSRIREIDAASNPYEHLRGLTGIDLQAEPAHESAAFVQDRPPVARGRRRLRWPAAVGALAALTLLVMVASVFSRPEYAGTAYRTAVEFDAGSRLAGSSLPEADRLYLEAIGDIRASRGSTLGLFPHYDAGNLDAAGARLERAVALSDQDPWLNTEARFLLAAVYMARGDVAAACPHLDRLAQEESSRAAQAVDWFDEECGGER